MALQVQQEQLKNPFVRQKRVWFCPLTCCRSNFGNQLSFVWVFPSLISVEINMKKSNGFPLELPTDLISAETALKGLFHTVPCFPDVMEAETASTCRGWLHFARKSFLHFPRVGWGPESRRLMKHWANGETFQQFVRISLRSFFIFGSFGLMREMRETWHDQQPHVMIAWDMKEAEQLGW